MPRKGENIFKRRDGRWEARYIKGRELDGKIKYGFCYGRTYREAKEKSMLCKAAVLNNTPLPVTRRRHRLAFYCEEWLRMERGRVKDSTYVKYDTILQNHILPKLGGCCPQGFTSPLAEQFKQALLDQGLGAKTVRDILTVLRSILKYTSARYPGVFPAVEITYPREQKKDARVLNVQEQTRFIEFLQTDMDECKFGTLLALLTGLRIGELCALRWGNVSLCSKTIRVDATMQRLKNLDGDGGKTKIVISTPKSDTSTRTIPLSDSAAKLCSCFYHHSPSAFLLTGTEQYMEPRMLQKRLAEYTRACGLEGVHFHTIRHTFATRCVEAGVEIKSLSEILGHADISITLGRYVHPSMELKRTNMNKLTFAGL